MTQKNKIELYDVEAKCRADLPKDLVDFIDASRDEQYSESKLIAVLHKAQEIFGYLSEDVLNSIAQLMQIPAAKISGVVTFYHYFKLEPHGKFVINVCTGTACYVKGAEEIVKKFSEELGIKVGETTTDGLFTLENARCLGACALAPVVKI
ncbi:MAG: NAD(P)H-dependent oxidoreductase subunit E, partial [Gammaproteobacteria bacterium]|nr:NAD(P)H-dependent oxidoreductase subunit E [Gammaproteobacteria bacterium]